MYRADTRGIAVTVTPAYSSERSAPEAGAWFWTYTIEIENLSSEPVRLLNRYWRIVDGNGQLFEVTGAGVVGEQPLIAPGGRFRYTSGVPLATASGMMAGHYEMVTDSGERFLAEVPAFSLDMPGTRGSIN